MWITIQYLSIFDIYPVEDIREHYMGDECWCNPRLEPVDGTPGLMIVHTALDNRE